MDIPIVYEDEDVLVVNKPANIHVHPTKLSRREVSLIDVLQKQIRVKLFPVHRLDRPVSGLLLLTKNQTAAGILGQSMRSKEIEKHYLCIVRGWMTGRGQIDRPLSPDPGKPEKEALTIWRSLATAECPWSDGDFPSSRYSLLECSPITGRRHQIRRHLSFIAHPILGDIARGDNPRNRIWKTRTEAEGIMLCSYRLKFKKPSDRMPVVLKIPPPGNICQAIHMLGWTRYLDRPSD